MIQKFLTAKRNFFKHEVVTSTVAKRYGIKNTMTVDDAIRATLLAVYVLQPIRDKFGIIKINSWKRVEKLNDRIGGSKNSQHLIAEAADIKPQKANLWTVYKWIRDNLEFDQLILEFSPKTHQPAWIHVSYTVRKKNRHQSWIEKR